MICDRQKNSFKPFSSSQAKKILLHRYLDVEEQDWEITAFDQILTQKKVIWWCEIFFLFSSTYYQISNWMKIFKSKNHVKLKMKMLSFEDGKEYTFLFFTKKKKGIMAIPYVLWIKMMWSHQWNWHKRNKIFETHDAFLARPTIEHQRRTVYVLLTAL